MCLIFTGVAGCCAKSAVAPLDRVKILMQAQNTHYKDLGNFGSMRNENPLGVCVCVRERERERVRTRVCVCVCTCMQNIKKIMCVHQCLSVHTYMCIVVKLTCHYHKLVFCMACAVIKLINVRCCCLHNNSVSDCCNSLMPVYWWLWPLWIFAALATDTVADTYLLALDTRIWMVLTEYNPDEGLD